LDRIVIHTAFTGTVPDVHVLTLEDLRDASKRRLLKWAFSEPERLRPGQTTAALTEAAAGSFGDLAQTLRARGYDPWAVGHFCIRVLFCLFAEDIELLPRQMFTRLLDAGLKQPARLPEMLGNLFGTMATGGLIGFESVDWFNGGLFDSADTLPLELDDIKTLRALAGLDWSAIEPSIFGTLFERGLDPDKRSQLGAHYTDRQSIMRLVDPVVLDPLRDEWNAAKVQLEALTVKAAAAKAAGTRTKAVNEALGVLQGFLARLAHFRVLDPACGSGAFPMGILHKLV
ncbi:class I SAM-dependent DNA methyltransferase, partial [bacterium]|nr:class I SAM-dependent DNA methyltransferase [bacterium]